MRTFAKGHTYLLNIHKCHTYHYTVLTCKFVNTGRVGLRLTARTTLLVTVVKDIEVITINVVADKDVGDEF